MNKELINKLNEWIELIGEVRNEEIDVLDEISEQTLFAIELDMIDMRESLQNKELYDANHNWSTNER